MSTPTHTRNNEFRRFHIASSSHLSSNTALRSELRKDIQRQTKTFLDAGGKVQSINLAQISASNSKATFNNQQAKAIS